MESVYVPVLVVLLLTISKESHPASIDGDCKTPRLLLVSYDGFMHDYFERGITPNSDAFMKEAVYVKRLKSVFPTKTFTNHFTIATGVYPEVHGISANALYDPKLGKLSYSAQMFQYNKDIVPIWTLNELANRTSGCMMWPGSGFSYRNRTCTYSHDFDRTMPMKHRVDTAIGWMVNKTKPANFVAIYCDRPDAAGHRFGVTGKQANNDVKMMDEITGYIQQQLKLHNLLDCTNVIHVSDHGMIEVNTSNIIELSPFLVNGTYKMYGSSPVLQIVPENGTSVDDIYNRLVNASNVLGHFKVYKQPDVPERWHVKMLRFGPIVTVADLHYVFQDLYNSIQYYNRTYNQTEIGLYGIHGYDNEYPEMAGILMAKGPSFPKAKILDDFQNIDLYNLFVKILQLPNAPATNGISKNADMLLMDKTVSTVSIVIAILLLLLVVICMVGFIIYRRSIRHCMLF